MKQFDWAKCSAVAEIFGAVAIVATLGYLAIQTNQNTAAILSGSRQAALEAELDFLYKSIDYPEMYSGQVPDFDDGLDYDTKVRRLVIAGVLIRTRESLWLQLQSGTIDPPVFEAYMESFLQVMEGDPYLRFQWSRIGNAIEPGFVEAVNRLAE